MKTRLCCNIVMGTAMAIGGLGLTAQTRAQPAAVAPVGTNAPTPAQQALALLKPAADRLSAARAFTFKTQNMVEVPSPVGWHCGGVSTGTAVAAGMAGLATGAMIGAAASRPVVVAPAPVYVTPAPVVVAPAPVVVAPAVPVGSIYYSLPSGAKSANINGVQYYVAGGVYYRPYFGSNGVYYQVAPNPI